MIDNFNKKDFIQEQVGNIILHNINCKINNEGNIGDIDIDEDDVIDDKITRDEHLIIFRHN